MGVRFWEKWLLSSPPILIPNEWHHDEKCGCKVVLILNTFQLLIYLSNYNKKKKIGIFKKLKVIHQMIALVWLFSLSIVSIDNCFTWIETHYLWSKHFVSSTFKAMLRKNVGTRAKWENVANERQEPKLEDEVGWIDGIRVRDEVSQVLSTSFSKLIKQRLGKPRI